MLAVKVHCGSAHVKGKARTYPYFVASLFESTVASSGGYEYWRNTGKSTHPRRSQKLAEQDGKELAEMHGAEFLNGYGSLHNRLVRPSHLTNTYLTVQAESNK